MSGRSSPRSCAPRRLRFVRRPLLRLAAPVLLAAAPFSACATMPSAQLVHDVYFTLHDPSPAACQALVDACYEQLATLPGVVFLAAGVRDRDRTRDVNDTDYDVSLHVHFADGAAHDAYQDAAAHRAFVEQHRETWRRVRVFDSTLDR